MKMKLHKHFFGIRKKLFLYMTGFSVIICFCICAAAARVSRKNIYQSMTDQYTYVNEKAFTHFENRYEEIDKLTDSWILNDVVQSSLGPGALTANERENLLQALSFLQTTDVDYYMYMDNKSGVYSQKNMNLSHDRFMESDLAGALAGYSKTCLYWGSDTVFSGEDDYLFAIRYVRHVERNYEPGILCLRMSPDFLNHILDGIDDQCVQLLYDRQGRLCDTYNPGAYDLSAARLGWIADNVGSTVPVTGPEGLLCATTDASTGFTIATYVPYGVLNSAVREIYLVMIVIFIVAMGLAMALSGFLAVKLTQPIKVINDYMVHFDDTRLGAYVDIQTNTELDTIGSSYNAMIDHVGELITTIRANEQALRTQEIHSLVNQLQPHFLYNTLDTIYMLARISHEETIMKMIYALSRYLRINLSKGADEIPVARELEHVCAYMDIQNIRNSGLFEYAVDCDPSLENLRVCKLILQPLAENAIKHGFCEMDTGGRIYIRISRSFENGKRLRIEFENNGKLMDGESQQRINRMETADMARIRELSGSGEGGYGVMNIVMRLRLKYGEGVRFYYVCTDVTTCVIEIPLDKLDGEAGVNAI